jgi:CRISPR-associated protein Csd2
MSNLQNKIDFVVLVKVTNANPNGDPLNGNRPRTTYEGYGQISDVCIKRKIRNRLQDMGENIFVQSDDRVDDGLTSLKDREAKWIKENKINTKDKILYCSEVCKKWIDVRTFGQVFAFAKSEDSDSRSASVRGPVSIHQAVSCSPVDINSMQITKSVNSEPAEKKSSDTMGTKHFVEFGLYKIKGSINVQLAEKTGFSEEDAEKLKEALRTLFINDASAARPDGSMEVVKVYWWKHNNKIGQYSAAKVHDSLKITLKENVMIPSSVDDYQIVLEELPDLKPEIIEGI